MQIRLLLGLVIAAFTLVACASSTKTTETAAGVQSEVQNTASESSAAGTSASSVESGGTEAAAVEQGTVESGTVETGVIEVDSSGNAGTSEGTTTVESGSTGTGESGVVTPPEPELTPVQKLVAAGDFRGARNLALADLREGKTTDSSEFWSVIEQDPLLSHTLDEEVRPHETNSISALGGGSTVSFKYKDSADESAKAALKPDQDLRQTMYRSGIAYYRMCQILGCRFDIPVTRPARFSKADFNALYNVENTGKNRGYKGQFVHLIWATENDTQYLYVGYKEWINSFKHFPIEATNTWSPYLKNPNKQVPELRTFLKNVLAGGRPDDGKYLNAFVEYAGDMTSRDILQQISDMILMDYLTNNWDRFAGGGPEHYGANCHFHDGGLLGIDNDAAFPPWHAPRVERRLAMVEMFSRDLVANLRTLDPDELLLHLFPNPTKSELASFERFKERRESALKYIDGLIKKKCEENVLVF